MQRQAPRPAAIGATQENPVLLDKTPEKEKKFIYQNGRPVPEHIKPEKKYVRNSQAPNYFIKRDDGNEERVFVVKQAKDQDYFIIDTETLAKVKVTFKKNEAVKKIRTNNGYFYFIFTTQNNKQGIQTEEKGMQVYPSDSVNVKISKLRREREKELANTASNKEAKTNDAEPKAKESNSETQLGKRKRTQSKSNTPCKRRKAKEEVICQTDDQKWYIEKDGYPGEYEVQDDWVIKKIGREYYAYKDRKKIQLFKRTTLIEKLKREGRLKKKGENVERPTFQDEFPPTPTDEFPRTPTDEFPSTPMIDAYTNLFSNRYPDTPPDSREYPSCSANSYEEETFIPQTEIENANTDILAKANELRKTAFQEKIKKVTAIAKQQSTHRDLEIALYEEEKAKEEEKEAKEKANSLSKKREYLSKQLEKLLAEEEKAKKILEKAKEKTTKQTSSRVLAEEKANTANKEVENASVREKSARRNAKQAEGEAAKEIAAGKTISTSSYSLHSHRPTDDTHTSTNYSSFDSIEKECNDWETPNDWENPEDFLNDNNSWNLNNSC